MNKLAMFFIGVMMLVVVFIAMFFTGAIFDASRQGTVETYFFQGNNFSYQRPGMPLTPKQLGDSRLFDLLVKKYVTEYLYVLPEAADIAHRESKTGALRMMSNDAVFTQWENTIAPEIHEMADAGMLRTVSVGTPLKYGDFYQVEFELKTWQFPNDMDEEPMIQSGVMQLKIKMSLSKSNAPEIKQDKLDTLSRGIKLGFDPVGVFDFGVSDVILLME